MAGSGHSWKSLTTSPDAAARNRWIAAQVQQLFSAYRKDDFADPESFVLQLVAVLSRYENAVVKEVTDPVTGLQRTCKFPPSIAEVVEACDYHSERNARIKELSEMRFERHEPHLPQNIANVFIPASSDMYEKALAWKEGGKRKDGRPIDPREWKWDQNGRAGIWIGFGALDELRGQIDKQQTWQRFSAEELMKLYPKQAEP